MTNKNRLYYGDNLDVLRRHVDDESVDLVYLDPPFNSNASYNVLFREHNGAEAASPRWRNRADDDSRGGRGLREHGACRIDHTVSR